MPASLSALSVESFERSRERFESMICQLADPETGQRTHGELEEQLSTEGRELMRTLLQDHLDLRARREVRQEVVTGSDAVARRAVEPTHERGLATVFGQVQVARLAYRARGAANLSPADAVLNLPAVKHSHGLRRLAAIESTRGSFQAAGEAIGRVCGTVLGKRQVEELTQAAAVDVDAFYTTRHRDPASDGDVLVLSVDGKGIVMRPEALREATRRAVANRPPPATRLAGGHHPGRKRMAEVGAVYDVTPAIRTPADILTTGHERPADPAPGPQARNKWLTASVTDDAADVIGAVLDEAQRRDPDHARCWVGLVDGNNHQIQTLTTEAKRHGVRVNIVIDFIHVLEYLHKAARCFFVEDDHAAQDWVAGHARRILHGQASTVTAAIRR
ncbi:MAG: ISKra4 family transposase, partial [Actinobacteria bacterium]|nr:ISKra4 family transposase [Actinomycetota bacterium]